VEGSSASGRYAAIDVLRGIAILFVVMVHSGQKVACTGLINGFAEVGQMGVQIFFVASAFTLYSSMARNLSLRNFYLRRYFRIAPLYYIGILFYAIYRGTHLDHWHLSIIIPNILLVHGLYPPSTNSVVPGGWSIGTEVLFYLIFPLIFSAIRSEKLAIQFIVSILLVNLSFQAMRIWYFHGSLAQVNNGYWYYCLSTQLPVFGFGILLYFQRSKKPNTMSGCFTSGSLLLLWMLFYLVPDGYLYFVLPSLAGWGALHLGRYLLQRSCDGKLSGVLAELGRKSYSIYLFHFVCLDFVASIFSTTTEQFPNLLRLVLYLSFTALLTYLVALASEKYIEETGIAFGRRVAAYLAPRSRGASH
jgi:peptidoglycan/LPS O-acetylase OafA/YrhL